MRRLAFVIVLVLAHRAHAADDRIEKARSAVLTDEYQKELPGNEIELGSGAGGLDLDGSGNLITHRHPRERRLTDFKDDRRRIDTRDYEMQQDSGGPFGGVLTFVMWGVVIVMVALMLFWLASELLKYGGDETQLADEPKPSESMVDMRVIERPLGDAEELAKRGEYGEAIHTLLLRTLQELVRSASVRVAPAMTSREILARVPLLADARDALSGLITAVELTHFGESEATLDDYVRCRDQFQRFAAAFRAAGERAARPGGGGTSLAGAR